MSAELERKRFSATLTHLLEIEREALRVRDARAALLDALSPFEMRVLLGVLEMMRERFAAKGE